MDQARRDAIIKIFGGAAALLALAVGACALSPGSTSPEEANQSSLATRASTVSGASETLVQSDIANEITVRVVYFGMPFAVTGAKKETVTLSNPAYLSDLKAMLAELHPTLKEMLPTMLLLVDGMSANGNPQLQNDVEVDILAQVSGG